MSYIKIFILSLVLISSALALIFPKALVFVILTSVIFLVLFIIYKSYSIRKLNLLDIIFFMFFLVSLVSCLYNSDFASLKSLIALFTLYFLLSIIFNSYLSDKSLSIAYYSLIISTFFILITSIIVNKKIFNAFAGIYNNPNSLGIIIAPLSVAIISKLILLIDKKKSLYPVIKIKFFSILLLVLSIYIVLLTQSRTSLVAILIVAIIIITIVFIKNIKNIKFVSKFIFTFFVAFLLILLSIFKIDIVQSAFYKIIEKFQQKSDDIFDGRVEIWLQSINESRLFGLGHNYYEYNSIGAHSTYISILVEFGWLSFVLYLLFFFVLLWKCIKLSIVKKYNNDYIYFPLALTLTYLGISITETLLYKPIMILLFIFSGINKNSNDK